MSASLPALQKAWLRAQRDLGCDDVIFDQPLRLPEPEPEAPLAPSAQSAHPARSVRPAGPAPVRERTIPVAPRAMPKTAPTPAVPVAPAPTRAPVLRPPAVPEFAARDELDAHVEACVRCRLKERARCVWSGGAEKSPWLVLTLYGWAEDLTTGQLLSGKYASSFLELSRSVGLPDPAVAAVLCCPPRDPADVAVQGRIEAARCRPYWTQILRLSGAKAVLVLDHKALQLSMGRAVDWKAFRGRRFELEGLPAVATHHPARLSRTAALAPEVEADLRQILSLTGSAA